MEDTKRLKGIDPDAESGFLIRGSKERSNHEIAIVVPSEEIVKKPGDVFPLEPPKLPTGEVIDAKNTLQSFPTQSSNTTRSTPGATQFVNPAVARTTNQAVPTLPSGEVIDSKNTLQSFPRPPSSNKNNATTSTVSQLEVNAASSNHPTLPNGEVINAKNTLQSFNIRAAGVLPQKDSGSQNSNSSDNAAVDPTSVRGDPSPTPHPNIDADVENVYFAELVTDTPRRKTTLLLSVLGILAIIAAAAVAGVCFSGKCGSGNDSDNLSSQTMKPTVPPTASPTAAPTGIDIRVQGVISAFINNITYLGQKISLHGTSAESRALNWTATEGLLFTFDESVLLSLSSFTDDNVSFRIRQRYSLATLYFQQATEDGISEKNWENKGGWIDENSDECEWYGIKCVNGSVTQILFYNVSGTNEANGYVGTIPPDIGLLTSLQNFSMRSNKVYGTIPESIGNCSHMLRFDIRGPDDGDGNSVSGTLPSSIGQWTDLTYFDVSQNNITGTIPESTENWMNVIIFVASSNQLVGSIPSFIGKWSGLRVLYASSNKLTNKIPEEIGNLVNISGLDLSSNLLTGALPFSIGRLTALSILRIQENSFTGTIPSSIGNWTLIKWALFEKNDFTGTMPPKICDNIQGDDILSCDCLVKVNCSCCTRCE